MTHITELSCSGADNGGMNFTAENWHYNVESLANFGCPHCGSDDLAFYGETGDRTDGDFTDHVTCEGCKVTWTNPDVTRINATLARLGMTLNDDQMHDALERAERAGLGTMADLDADVIATGIVATVLGV